jgi:hypothetical protein
LAFTGGTTRSLVSSCLTNGAQPMPDTCPQPIALD